MGSFVGCQAWRLRYKEQGKARLGKWSVCLSCGHRLSWYENIPILSWLFLRGRCRKCYQKIGWMELLIEVLMGLAFLGAGTTVNIMSLDWLGWAHFIVLLILISGLGFLAVYDGMWGKLPVAVLTFTGVCAIILVILKQWSLFLVDGFSWGNLLDILGGVALLGGVYAVLLLVSKGKWVGDGDYILGAILGLAVSSTWLSLIIMFLANFLGLTIMAPMGKKRIYFGPFLVIAFVIVLVFADALKGFLMINMVK